MKAPPHESILAAQRAVEDSLIEEAVSLVKIRDEFAAANLAEEICQPYARASDGVLQQPEKFVLEDVDGEQRYVRDIKADYLTLDQERRQVDNIFAALREFLNAYNRAVPYLAYRIRSEFELTNQRIDESLRKLSPSLVEIVTMMGKFADGADDSKFLTHYEGARPKRHTKARDACVEGFTGVFQIATLGVSWPSE